MSEAAEDSRTRRETDGGPVDVGPSRTDPVVDYAGRRTDSTVLRPRAGERADAVAALLVALAFVVVAPSPLLGALAGGATAAVWYTLGTQYALAAGHVALVALFPDGIDALPFALVEAAFLALLLAPAVRTRAPSRYVGATVASLLPVGAAAWLALGTGSIALAGGAMLATIALAVYGLHRFALVALEKVPDRADDSTHTNP